MGYNKVTIRAEHGLVVTIRAEHGLVVTIRAEHGLGDLGAGVADGRWWRDSWDIDNDEGI